MYRNGIFRGVLQQLGISSGKSSKWARGAATFTSATTYNPKLAKWLFLCSGLTASIVLVGGITRLTESGLSITKWEVASGVMPPMNEAAWEAEFEEYKKFPEFRQRSEDMTLNEFKFIYFFEWLHRVLGRTLGVTYAVPLAYFWGRGYIPPHLRTRMAGLAGLIGIQGLIGWIMVKSGLEHQNFEDGSRVRVSPYRLTTHLSTAFVLYLGFLWTALELKYPHLKGACNDFPAAPIMRSRAIFVTSFVFLTAMYGALVAGLDAGMVYNTFPKMGNTWLPPDFAGMQPKWKSFLEHDATVQFVHRCLGLSSLVLLAHFAHDMKKCVPKTHRAFRIMRGAQHAAILQVALGITAVLHSVPIPIASAHQLNSMALLSALLGLVFVLPP